MSDIRDDMLRTLDRIVEDYPVAFEPSRDAIERAAKAIPGSSVDSLETARSTLVWRQQSARHEAVGAAGFVDIGGTGAEGDIPFADAAALIRRAAYHSLDVDIGAYIVARRIAARSRFTVPEGKTITFGRSRDGTPVRPFKAADGVQQVQGSLVSASPWGSHIIGDVTDAEGLEHLALVRPPCITVIIGEHERGRNIAEERREDVHLEDLPTALPRQQVLALVPAPGARDMLLAEGALLRSIQITGALDRTLEHCLTWVNDRIQFGRPIAKHQAVQHLMAQLAEEVAAAAAAADLAIEASAAGPDTFAIAVAKSRTGEAAGKAANLAHAIFGAMGFTREHPLHLSTRRLWAWRNEFGGEAYWQRELGRRIAAKGGASLWPTLTAAG